MDNRKLENLTLEEIDKHIIYAPNSSGKTRLSKKLVEENDGVLLFTSSSIDDLLNITGKTINVGIEAKLVSRNAEIEKLVNKTDFANAIKNIYDVKAAKDLHSKSFIFSWGDIKKLQSFDLLNVLHSFSKHFNISKNVYDFDIGLFIDQKLKIDLYKKIEKVFETTILTEIELDDNFISKSTFEKLSYIFSILGDDTACPLCGYNWKDSKLLKGRIKNKLSSYKILESEDNKSSLLELYNLFNICNDHFERKIFNVSKENATNILVLKENFQLLLSFIYSFADDLIRKYSYQDDFLMISEHEKNNDEINNTKKERVKTNSFEMDVLNIIGKIIVLPEGFNFVADSGSIKIINSKNNYIDPSKFLSESEKRRFYIAVLFAEAKSRDTKFLLLDDPADSNDDYYFDSLINLIIDFLNQNHTFGWALLTHEVRVPYLFSQEQKRLSIKNTIVTYKYLFFLPDPSDGGDRKPPLSCYEVSSTDIDIINEHEIVLFSKIFHNESGYEVDPELALLSSFNQCRGLYNELIKQHKIKNKQSKLLKKKIAKVTSSYEHYIFDHSKSATIYDLYSMNKIAYKKDYIDSRFHISKSTYAFNYRARFLKKRYSSIICTNPLIKYILYTVLRVLNCHYNFERRLADWANNNIAGFDKNKFENTFCIGKKLNNVNGYMPACSNNIQNDFNKFDVLFSKSRKLLNDFSHSASMMFPPFLSVNPLDISRLENEISKLPR